MKTKFSVISVVVLQLMFLSGCAGTPHARVFEQSSAVQLRSFQSRTFNTTDKQKTLRTVIAALQDLGFVIDKADAVIGTVTATKFDGYELRATVTVRPRGETQTLVRANATIDNRAIEEPEPYQDFFVVLEKAMFLTAQQID